MSDIAVSVRGLGKQYHLGATRERYSTLRDSINKFTSAPLRRLLRRAKAAEKNPPFWALKDVSFDVKRGEVVGIIGRNGAGKSTLLKILSRITEPTEGEADIHGRVGSLLEVGTGFHPELTGRENVYLNGAILGMRRSEIARKFDEIVAFAEVEKFIDTPVKHYSSGMYMRLAFAVAAHLEPEVLVVDEVLAVGDAQFQKKCLGKMGDVAKGGRTVLFVSHNMQVVQGLCGRAVLLVGGRTARVWTTADVVRDYLAGGVAGREFVCDPGGRGLVTIRRVKAEVEASHDRTELRLEMDLDAVVQATVSLDVRVRDAIGTPVGIAPVGSFDPADELRLAAGPNSIRTVHDISLLADGVYRLSVDVARTMVEILDRVEDCVTLEVHRSPPTGWFRRPAQQYGWGSVSFPTVAAETVARPAGREGA